MGKPITVQSCAYVHPDDIDPQAHASANDIEAAKDKAVARAIAALENNAAGWGQFRRAHLQTLQTPGLTPDEQLTILWGNAAKLLKLPQA